MQYNKTKRTKITKGTKRKARGFSNTGAFRVSRRQIAELEQNFISILDALSPGRKINLHP